LQPRHDPDLEPEKAIETPPDLAPSEAERRKAIEVVEFVAGSIEEMALKTLQMARRFRVALGPPGLALSVAPLDPLTENSNGREDC
jgi:hypothetical protein